MPRKAFIADLKALAQDTHVTSISNVQAGSDDGEVKFRVTPEIAGDSFEITAMVSDVSEYPSSHAYLLCAADDCPKEYAQALEPLQSTFGKSLGQLLDLISRTFVTSDGDGDALMLDSQLEEEECEEEDHVSEDEDENGFLDGTHGSSRAGPGTPSSKAQGGLSSQSKDRIRSDLRITKDPGFRIGCHGPLTDRASCYVSVACRMLRLGISEEAMQAWNIEPSEYLVLLLQYPNGYKTIDMLKEQGSHMARQSVQMRVGTSDRYKPTLQDVIQAFSKSNDEEAARKRDLEQDNSARVDRSKGTFRNLFISRPLNELLNERLIPLINYRAIGMRWNGAEQFYNDNQGKNFAVHARMEDKYMEDETLHTTYPRIVLSDHLTEHPTTQSVSFVLTAMQFLLRHFVRCTEFCLVCHCKLPNDLEAIKPYVCDKPLCLYQYMSLGFGPSIEHEIIAQPYVVDLLISFCYVRASAGQLTHEQFPTGLSLMVPPPSALISERKPYSGHARGLSVSQPAVERPATPSKSYTAKFDWSNLELLFEAGKQCPVSTKDWIVVREADNNKDPPWYCRVAETAYFPVVRVSQPLTTTFPSDPQGNDRMPRTHTNHSVAEKAPAVMPTWKSAVFHVYDQNFDFLTNSEKCESIVYLLNSLPSVKEMRSYLTRRPTATLRDWVDRISPAALGLLRWIIASSRACIMQVDDLDGPDQEVKTRKFEERLYGMNGWMQFRFAMGAPDKESRFLKSVRSVSERLNLKYPTIYAWHGSALSNWHSIIREGLHFKTTVNGRAYGDGVYFSLAASTSQGYSGYYGRSYGTISLAWPQSQLKISTALALNEIVNAPNEFVSRSPHLVVKQLDWIQTRYLFVQCNGELAKLVQNDTAPEHELKQDPAMTPCGPTGGKIVIPLSSVARLRRSARQAGKVQSPRKRKFVGIGSPSDPITLDDDAASEGTDVEDLEIFFSDDQPAAGPAYTGKGKGVASTNVTRTPPAKPMTDFVPGTLDHSTLPLMQEPSYATPPATRRLQQDLRSLLKIQQSNPAHELGWYINPELFSNVYQWIVELHSFESQLPLARDMKSRSIKSIVLELRFGKDYPWSPPFVRVIRPRFLSFMQGGGGHVTAGGALCMELLTNNGWTSVSSVESVLLQVRLALSSTDPKPARLDNSRQPQDYSVGEAVDAYLRACQVHGWTVPADFRQTALGS